MKILVINGPNINMLGLREPDVYGKDNFKTLCKTVKDYAKKNKYKLKMFQSNHEGSLVDAIQRAYKKYDGIVINPGAYTHTSIALLDALKSVQIPTVEVHISAVEKREDFRQVSFIRNACIGTVTGEGINGYLTAIKILKEHIEGKK